MISAGCRYHSRRRNVAGQQIGERAASLKGTGMLEQFQFKKEANAFESQVGPIDLNHGRAPDIRADEFLGGGDAVLSKVWMDHAEGGCAGCASIRESLDSVPARHAPVGSGCARQTSRRAVGTCS